MNAKKPNLSLAANLPYKSPTPQPAVVNLVFIENSHAMAPAWPGLRDQYLSTFVRNLGPENPPTPATNLLLESKPLGSDMAPTAPRQCDSFQESLRDVQFNYDAENRLSPGAIWAGIDFLTSKFRGQGVNRHIVIVAASAPRNEAPDADIHALGGRTVWQRLAQRLAQDNVQCHIILRRTQDMVAYVTLFEETLRMQNYIEVLPPLQYDQTDLLIRLSVRPGQDFCSDPAPYADPSYNRLPLRRTVRGHIDTVPVPSVHEQRPPAESKPSLVTQLQQFHGLTKKKVYGTKPPRLPFFRDERVSPKPYSESDLLATPPLLVPSSTGRAMPPSRADRMSRIAQTSPTESHSRRPASTRRGSRVSSPDSMSGLVAAPVGSQLSPHVPSPVSPQLSDPYAAHTSSPGSQAYTLKDDVLQDPTWLQPQPQRHVSSLSQGLAATSYSLPQDQGSVVRSQRQRTDVTSAGYSYSYLSPAATTQHRAILHSGVPQPTQTDPIASVSSSSTPRSAKPSRPPLPKDEERFMFSDDYVAATAIMFAREVLPLYPNFESMGQPKKSSATTPSSVSDSSNTRRNPSTPVPEQGSSPVGPMSNLDDVQSTLSYDYTLSDAQISYASGYVSGSTSSLTGWAG